MLRGVAGRLGDSARHTHLGSDGEGLLEVPFDGADAPVLDVAAVDWLLEGSRAERLQLVATALRRDPSLAGRLRGLAVMGGMVHPEHFSPWWQAWLGSPGNRGEQLDYNTACDPVAALACAESGVAMTWVTMEVTLRTGMTRDALASLRAEGTPFCEALARVTAIWAERHYRHEAHDLPGTVANWHDPLAVASVIGGPWLTLRSERLRYAVDGGLFSARPAADGAPALVSVGADSGLFEAEWLRRVRSLGRRP